MTTEAQKQEIYQVLSEVQDPVQQKDIISLGLVKNLRVCGGNCAFDLELTSPSPVVRERLEKECREKVLALSGLEQLNINFITHPSGKGTPKAGGPTPNSIPGIKRIIAVGSGKGGVGKSTTAVNLAVSLLEDGHKVGLMDADIYGPSIPTMLGVRQEPVMTMSNKLVPVMYRDMKFMSVGLITGDDAPVIWRGPLATQLVQQFLFQVEWGELDYLIVDLPPGTGDIHITLCQNIPLDGAVVVTTPQDVSFTIARKAWRMFEKLQVPVLGFVENMSGFICSCCGEVVPIFGDQATEELCHELGVPFLGRVPLESQVVEGGDEGKPIVVLNKESIAAKAFIKVAFEMEDRILELEGGGDRVVPVEFSLNKPEEFQISWSDGPVHQYSAYHLRISCPCALCIDEWTGEAKLKVASVSRDISIVHFSQVGNYALAFEFSDGHRTGIYTYEYLQKLSKEATPKLADPFEV